MVEFSTSMRDTIVKNSSERKKSTLNLLPSNEFDNEQKKAHKICVGGSL